VKKAVKVWQKLAAKYYIKKSGTGPDGRGLLRKLNHHITNSRAYSAVALAYQSSNPAFGNLHEFLVYLSGVILLFPFIFQ